MSRLSIIIVNYISAKLINDCVTSLYEFFHDNLEIIAVDNDSGVDSEKINKTNFPSIHWIQNTYNTGFSKANIEEMKIATRDTFLLLNPETILLYYLNQNILHMGFSYWIENTYR